MQGNLKLELVVSPDGERFLVELVILSTDPNFPIYDEDGQLDKDLMKECPYDPQAQILFKRYLFKDEFKRPERAAERYEELLREYFSEMSKDKQRT